jgi:tetratricopeptide (TPR) repeat protein
LAGLGFGNASEISTREIYTRVTEFSQNHEVLLHIASLLMDDHAVDHAVDHARAAYEKAAESTTDREILLDIAMILEHKIPGAKGAATRVYAKAAESTTDRKILDIARKLIWLKAPGAIDAAIKVYARAATLLPENDRLNIAGILIELNTPDTIDCAMKIYADIAELSTEFKQRLREPEILLLAANGVIEKMAHVMWSNAGRHAAMICIKAAELSRGLTWGQTPDVPTIETCVLAANFAENLAENPDCSLYIANGLINSKAIGPAIKVFVKAANATRNSEKLLWIVKTVRELKVPDAIDDKLKIYERAASLITDSAILLDIIRTVRMLNTPNAMYAAMRIYERAAELTTDSKILSKIVREVGWMTRHLPGTRDAEIRIYTKAAMSLPENDSLDIAGTLVRQNTPEAIGAAVRIYERVAGLTTDRNKRLNIAGVLIKLKVPEAIYPAMKIYADIAGSLAELARCSAELVQRQKDYSLMLLGIVNGLSKIDNDEARQAVTLIRKEPSVARRLRAYSKGMYG